MKKMMILVSILLLSASISLAAVPTKINYQGVLKDSAGNVINNPSLSIIFSIYSGASGGTALWTETQSVSIEAGLYNVQLGGVTAIPADGTIFDGSTRYLGIKVGTDTEMTPRLPMVSVPYAFLAQAAVGAVSAESATRLGSYLPAQTGSGSFVPVTSSGKLDTSVIPSGATLTTAGTAPATRAENSSTYENAEALTGVITSTAPGLYSAGVRGINNGIGGSGIGVWGSQNGSGWGVYGSSESGTGVYGYSPNGWGVRGESQSNTGRGVYGLASGTGLNYGGYFMASGNTGRGVYGEGGPAGVPGGAGYGGYFVGNGNSGTGVYAEGVTGVAAGGQAYGGYFSAANADGIGLFGTAEGTSGVGVYGLANSASGVNYGVYGTTPSTNGKGVYGGATAASGTNYAVFGETFSPNGYGVYGINQNATGNAVGVYGQTVSDTGRAVYGYATDGTGVNYGVYGRTFSPAGYGVYAKGKTDDNVAAYIESVLQLKPIASAPSSPTAGMIYVNSSTNRIYCYLGGDWRELNTAP